MGANDAKNLGKNVSDSGEDQSVPGGPEVWSRVCASLARNLDHIEYDKWISGLRFICEVDGAVLIAANTRFAFDRVNVQYKRAIEQAWKALDPKQRMLRLECWANVSADIKELAGDPWAEVSALEHTSPAVTQAMEPATGQASGQASGLPLNAAPAGKLMGPGVMRFDTLVIGESNNVAATVARGIAQRRDQVPASVIVINGLQGVGKTHLMKALETALQMDEAYKVAYISAEEFLVAYVDGAKNGDTRELKARVREADVVLFDDLQTIAGKKGTNDELSATLRTVTSRGGIAVLTADRAPADMEGLSTGVMTVLKGAACIEIAMPDTEMRLEIVRQRVRLLSQSSENFTVDDEMCREIVARVHGPGRDLCGAVVSLYTETGLGAVAPTPAMLDRVLSRQQKPKPISMNMVKLAVCKSFDMTKSDLEGERKFQRFVRARQVGMYLARELTDKSFPQIGISFGKRHHTTALYAWRKIPVL